MSVKLALVAGLDRVNEGDLGHLAITVVEQLFFILLLEECENRGHRVEAVDHARLIPLLQRMYSERDLVLFWLLVYARRAHLRRTLRRVQYDSIHRALLMRLLMAEFSILSEGVAHEAGVAFVALQLII